MNRHLTQIWRTFRFPLMLTFAILPLPFLLVAYFAPAYLHLVWLWPLTYVLLDALSTKIRKKWRILYGIAEVLVVAALTYLMVTPSTDFRFYFIPIIYIPVLLAGLGLKPEGRNEQISPVWIVIGMLSHILGQVLQFTSSETSSLDAISPWVLIAFFLFILIGLITLNQNTLSTSASGRQNASKAMQRKNLLLTFAFFAIALAITFIPNLVSAVADFVRWLPEAILLLLSKLHSNRSDTIYSNTTEDAPSNLDSSGSAAVFPPWLDKTISVILFLVFLCVMFWVMLYLYHKIVDLCKLIRRILTKYLHAVSEDYIDEITDTRTDHVQTELIQKREQKLSATEIRKLTPNQQVRYRYRQLMRKHPEWKRGSTARENLNNTAASVYERVRYSNSTVSPEDARKFASETKKV